MVTPPPPGAVAITSIAIVYEALDVEIVPVGDWADAEQAGL
jgi:hypothetical protein